VKLQLAQPDSFQEQTVPQGTRLAGVAALVHELAVAAPVRRPSCVADQHVSGSRRADGAWTAFDKRYWPGDALADHLAFLLKHENADLLVFKRLFDALPKPKSRTWCARRLPRRTSAEPGSCTKR
jgi:hypothetical protein